MTTQYSFPAGDPVPAVTEAAATGPVAAIFADLRATLGVPLVNLVWRHLATRPAALDWTWTTLAPLYRSGAIAGEAARLGARIPLPAATPWPQAAFRAVGIGAGDEAAIAAVLASYDRGNAMNLLAFSALLAHLDGERPAGPPRLADPDPLDAPLPALLDLAAVAPETADLALRLNRLGQAGEGAILASLYRHIAHWPAYMALAWTRLEPMARRGELEAAIAGTRTAAADGGRALLSAMPAVPAAGPGDRAFARGALELFVGQGIARMTAIGRILLAAHPR
ncbi:hypothetical protein [Stella sp.]|uniref:hypothetical protein n=1 Tax=Stella sp. TaxID=2912054 RepID=UPI0035B3EB97